MNNVKEKLVGMSHKTFEENAQELITYISDDVKAVQSFMLHESLSFPFDDCKDASIAIVGNSPIILNNEYGGVSFSVKETLDPSLGYNGLSIEFLERTPSKLKLLLNNKYNINPKRIPSIIIPHNIEYFTVLFLISILPFKKK